MDSKSTFSVHAIDVTARTDFLGSDALFQLCKRLPLEGCITSCLIKITAGGYNPVPLTEIFVCHHFRARFCISQDGIAPGVCYEQRFAGSACFGCLTHFPDKVAAVFVPFVKYVFPFTGNMYLKAAAAGHGVYVAALSDIYFIQRIPCFTLCRFEVDSAMGLLAIFGCDQVV